MKRQPAETTLADLQKRGGWGWAYCEGQGCGQGAPLAVAPFAIRWGLNASSDLMAALLTLRAAWCCAKDVELGQQHGGRAASSSSFRGLYGPDRVAQAFRSGSTWRASRAERRRAARHAFARRR